MASIQRLDTTNLSSPDAGLHNVGSHRSFGGAGLDKSHSFRESHEGRVSGPSTSHGGEGVPLTSVLFLESISFPSAKSNAQVELRRAMNAASGQVSEDSGLGNVQSKALENCSGEEIKRIRVGLQESANRAKERVRHLSEAVIKVDRFQAMQSRKRNRADGGAHDRPSHGGPGPRGAGLGHVTKGSGRGASSSGEGSGMAMVSNMGTQKGGDKKGGMINKRMRTSLADARPEGRPSNLSVQRSSGVQERDRESPRPSGLVSCSVEEKDKGSVGGSAGGSEGWEKTKLKGRRSATVKAEASSVVSSMNGVADGEREQKGNSQQYRAAGDGRSRPSEGHGYRSGPVHGSLSVQKAESVGLTNGSGIRGGSKLEGEVGVQSAGKAERASLAERERSNGKGLAKPLGRDEGRPATLGIVPKAKGARAPRSNLVAGGNQPGQMGRSSSFAEAREKLTVTSPAKALVPTGPINRKRAAPSRSSSPPVASWGSSRPQKKARARRVNVMPPVISVSSKEEASGVEDLGTPSREGSASGAAPTSRSSPAVTGVAKRASGGQSAPPSKAQTERLSVSVGPAVSEVGLDDGQKIKGRRRKQEEEEGEQKVSGTSEKSGTVVVVTSRGGSVGGEESGGGDGVRRQGRTGRGPVTPRVVSSPIEKAEVSPVMVKPTRVGRATVETKVAGVGRPAKNGNSDRKISSRPRRLLNNNGTEYPGDEEDDHEQLSRAVHQAVEFSALACHNSFWRQVEPYFSYVTADDLSLLHRHMAISDEINPTSQYRSEGVAGKSPTTGDRVSDSDEVKNWNSAREQSGKESNLRRGRVGGWYDKVFPLSQLVLSAIISEREDDDRQKISDESCADRDSDSPLHLSNHSEIDYDRRDAEGESDVDNLKPDTEWWSTGAREGGYGKGSPRSGGQGTRPWAEDQDGDDLIFRSNGSQTPGADVGNGGEVPVRDSQGGFGRQLGNGLMEWDEQYRRMNLDDRLWLELSSIGLLPGHSQVEHHEQEVDDIGDELRRLQADLSEQVSRNKEHLCRLESAVVENRAADERAREKLAMDKLVELAYKKKSGGRSAKGAAAKGAKTVALAFATRVLARVHDYEAGHSCITDPALRDRLFCVPPSLVESTPDAAMDAGAIATTAERITSPTGAILAGVSAGHRMEDAERPAYNGQSAAMDFKRLKDETWAPRGRDREAYLEDVSGYTSTRDVNTLSSNGLGGIKGKRSERDRDAKGGAPVRSGPTNAKGERKAKTKPRQKTGPVLKPLQGLGAKTADQQPGKGRPSNHDGYGPRHATRREEAMASLPVFQDMQPEPDAPLDLGALPLPGIEEMNMDQSDIGSWLDFNLEDPDGSLMGLDIPMDDLSGLMMGI